MINFLKGATPFATFLLVLTIFAFDQIRLFWTPLPYGNVRVVEAYEEDGYLYVTVNFEKYRCEIKNFVVLGTLVEGLNVPLKAEDVDTEETSPDEEGVVPEKGFRTNGTQTLRHRYFLKGHDFISVEARTSHSCPSRTNEEKVVGKTFFRLEEWG